MTILQAIIMAIVQGLTEFLPVSSSGHLVITSDLVKYFTGSNLQNGTPEEIFLDILLHVGTLVAVLIYFWPEFSTLFNPKNILEHFNLYKIKSLKTIKTDLVNNYNELSINSRMLFYLGVSTLATIIIAFPLKDIAEELTKNPYIVSFMLIVTGCLLFGSHIMSKKTQESTKQLDLKNTIIIGLAQGCAILPGISRSGSTISAGLMTGLSRVTAAKFSFILSSPIILLAALYEGFKFFKDGHMDDFNWIALLIGTVVSAIVGYLCIKYFIKFLSKHNLLVFAYYCWIVGIAMIVFYTYVR